MDETQENMPTAPTSEVSHKPDERADELWMRVFLIVFCGLAALIAVLFAYFYFQRPEAFMSQRLEDAIMQPSLSGTALCLYYVKTLQYNIRLLIALRFLGMFVGALCILLGALFLLKGIETNYQFNLRSDRASSSINTSSPGLVLITLGVLLVALTQFRDQELVGSTFPSCGQLSALPAKPIAPMIEPSRSPAMGPDGGAQDLAAPQSSVPSDALSKPATVDGGTPAPAADRASDGQTVDKKKAASRRKKAKSS